MKYAYLDTAGVLHIKEGDTESVRRNSRNGKCEAVEYPAQGGYPFKGSDGGQIVVYGEHECYKNGGNRTEDARLDTAVVYPELATLYRKLA